MSTSPTGEPNEERRGDSTAMAEINLPTQTGTVRLISEGNWCRVFLIADDRPAVELGADTIQIVVSRLTALASRPEYSPMTTKPGDATLCWILSLAEGHSSMYAEPALGVTRILIQNRDGIVSHTFKLRPSDLRVWIERLASA